MRSRAGAILSVLLCLAAIATIALAAKYVFTSPSTSGGTAVEGIGVIAGAIFVAGGLVVALAALATLLHVEERVRVAVDARYRQLEERTDDHIAARVAVALIPHEAHGWRDLVRMTESALERYPTLTGAVADLADTLSDIVFSGYHDKIGFPTDVMGGVVSWSGVPCTTASEWLGRALQRKEGKVSLILARQALVHGLGGDYLTCLELAGRAHTLDPTAGAWLQEQGRFLILAEACLTVSMLAEAQESSGARLVLAASDLRDQMSASELRWNNNEALGYAEPSRYVSLWVREIDGGENLVSGEAPRIVTLLLLSRGEPSGYKIRRPNKGEPDWPPEGWEALEKVLHHVLDRYVVIAAQ